MRDFGPCEYPDQGHKNLGRDYQQVCETMKIVFQQLGQDQSNVLSVFWKNALAVWKESRIGSKKLKCLVLRMSYPLVLSFLQIL